MQPNQWNKIPDSLGAFREMGRQSRSGHWTARGAGARAGMDRGASGDSHPFRLPWLTMSPRPPAAVTIYAYVFVGYRSVLH